ncbi:hypothetical protein [Blastopirellula marina]|uniref:Uncharacterized protein n=1 Tax=Blastopirellula marina TaxID=124 RepID=A0A2S8GNP9_9BACT|nr:hypothetical protein [Blastopirellula marina]PQO45644.1 hypothetical protein C5Y93_14510 [Blastopirellula marina]
MIYGYCEDGDLNEHGLKQLKSIGIDASPEDLRLLIAFLHEVADEMEEAEGLQLIHENWHRHPDRDLVNRLGCDLAVSPRSSHFFRSR